MVGDLGEFQLCDFTGLGVIQIGSLKPHSGPLSGSNRGNLPFNNLSDDGLG
jgi:hypothetical protein